MPGVAKGEGASLVDLPALRGVDAFVHVVRAFESDAAPHPEGSVDPRRDAAMLELELILADLGTVERRLERLVANIKKAHKPEDVAEHALFERLREALEAERPLARASALAGGAQATAGLRAAQREAAAAGREPRGGGDPRGGGVSRLVRPRARSRRGRESASWPSLRRSRRRWPSCRLRTPATFREDLGLAEPGLDRVIRSTYELLGLVSFLTAGEDECRAWTIARGTKAQQAAGTIHSDIERGFIRAQVVAFPDLVAAGSLAACREHGTLRLEGRDYEVRDGDVIEFKFNV